MVERTFTPAEIARSVLADMDEPARAELMTTLLCELSGPGTVALLSLARRAITDRLHGLLAAELGALDETEGRS